jgi:hypothetical protein
MLGMNCVPADLVADRLVVEAQSVSGELSG